MRRLVALTLAAATTTALAGCGVFGGGGEPADLQVYSARHYDLEDAFATFTEDTGITVDFLFADNAELLEKIKAEGENSPADLYLTVDAGNLWNAAQQGILAPIDSPTLTSAVPAGYRDPQGEWFGLAMRARTVIYNPQAVDSSEFSTTDTYKDLADPKWKGRLCMRDSTEAYTQSLVASLIDLYGHDETAAIVEGWLDNDVEIMSNDVLLIEAVDSGACDVAIVNHYYLAREIADNPDLGVKLFWASQDGAGTHVNLSGGGVVVTSDNKEQAQQLLEWLATDGQASFIGGNHEFPVNSGVSADEIVLGFGSFTPMQLDAEAYGSHNAEAVELLAEVGYA
jgi:iron(III) transport system substrate-binding protein